MSVEYGPKGVVGVLTPQANTTVEPEYAILMPPGYAFLNARILSPKKTIEERLVDYFNSLESYTSEFANAPIDALCVATTGMSYMVGKDAEDQKLGAMSKKLGIPVMTAATAVLMALEAIGAKKVGLVSPYAGKLDEACKPYWVSRGLEVVAQTNAVWEKGETFHPIYSLKANAAQDALDRMAGQPIDAVVMLGTGMATLRPIADTPVLGKAPVISCMFALIWANCVVMDGRKPNGDDLMKWLNGKWWRDRLNAPSI